MVQCPSLELMQVKETEWVRNTKDVNLESLGGFDRLTLGKGFPMDRFKD